MEGLGLASSPQTVLLPLPKPKSVPKRRTKRRRPTAREREQPTRKSRRLAGQKAPDYYAENVVVERRGKNGQAVSDDESEEPERGLDFMPLSVDDLIPEEKNAFSTLRKV